MFDERPIVLLVHAVDDLISGGYALYPDGRVAIVTSLNALTALLRLSDLNRIDHDDVRNFVIHAAARINHDLGLESEP